MNDCNENKPVMEILHAEFGYWSNPPTDRPIDPGIELGATAAIANVIAAMHGFPAPWHKGEPGNSNSIWPAETRVLCGSSRLGIIRMRILHPSVMRCWMFGIAVPSRLVRFLGGK